MKFISAGHCQVAGPNYDPGAVGVNGRKEADEAARIRNRVVDILAERNYTDVRRDLDNESLSQYLHRIKPGCSSFVCEFHFNAGSEQAHGVEVIVGADADRLDKMAATEFASASAMIMGVKNRGVKNETETHRGRLGLMREHGIVILVEVCFITNKNDMDKFDLSFERLCQTYADLAIKYDAMVA